MKKGIQLGIATLLLLCASASAQLYNEPVAKPAPNPPKKAEEVVEKKPDVPMVPPMPEIPIIVGPNPRAVGERPPEPRAPDSERRAIATFDSPTQPLLFERRDTSRWERIEVNDGRLASTDTLLALRR